MRKLNDDDFDENGVLKDGRSIRVPMMMMDAVQRGVAQLHDGRGGPVGHRPGFAVTTDATALDAKEEAYADYHADLVSAWKRDSPPAGHDPPSAKQDALPAPDGRRDPYDEYDCTITDAWSAR
jgi:hypothetical protein